MNTQRRAERKRRTSASRQVWRRALRGLVVLGIGFAVGACDIGPPFKPLSDSGPQRTPPNDPPSIHPPQYAAFTRGREGTFVVQASDYDGQMVARIELDASSLPSGSDARMTDFKPDIYDAQATFRWTPGSSDTGVFHPRFRAGNDRVGSWAATTLYTTDHADDRAPVVSCPDTMQTIAGMTREISVSAADPEGDPIFEFVASNSGPYWPHQIAGSTASGVLSFRSPWPGTDSVSFFAVNALHGRGTTRLDVREPTARVLIGENGSHCFASPETLSMAVGQTVGWVNSCMTMTLLEDSGRFRITSAPAGYSPPVFLTEAGTWSYHSEDGSIHGVIFVTR